MQKILKWFWFNLKSIFKTKLCFASLALMLLLCLIVTNIKEKEDADNNVGYVKDSTEFSNMFCDKLSTSSSYKYVEYDDLESLYDDVMDGILICGFVFDFERKNNKDIFTYYAAPMCTEGEVVKEDIYSNFLYAYSDVYIKSEVLNVFGKDDQELINSIISKKDEYLSGDSLFSATVSVKRLDYTEKEKKSYSISHIIYVFAFLIVFMMYGMRYDLKLRDKMTRREKIVFDIIYLFCWYLPFGVLGYVLLSLIEGGWLINLFHFIILGIYSVLWTKVFGGLLKKRETYISVSVSLMLLLVIVCPIFIDLKEYISAIRYIRLFMPPALF